MSEEEIVRGICSGSHHLHGALRAWVTGPLGARMQRFFISHGVAAPDAEDVLQDTIVNVVTKAHTFRADGEARSWVWAIARNCMSDHFRRSDGYQSKPQSPDSVTSSRATAANDAVVSIENGVPVTRLPYVEQPSNRVEGKASPRPVHLDDEQWRAVEETVAGPTHAQEVDSVDECVSRGIEAFSAQMPERGWALAMQMDGASVSEIAAQLGRTVAAAKEYLSQCRRHLQPFIANCRELLSP